MKVFQDTSAVTLGSQCPFPIQQITASGSTEMVLFLPTLLSTTGLPSDNTATYAFLPLAVSVEVARPFLGKYTHTDETDTVITILGKCQNILGFNGDGFALRQLIDDNVLSVIGVICNGITVQTDLHQRNIFFL